jgi:hypothetical protein
MRRGGIVRRRKLLISAAAAYPAWRWRGISKRRGSSRGGITLAHLAVKKKAVVK